jgi:hypothetical protein
MKRGEFSGKVMKRADNGAKKISEKKFDFLLAFVRTVCYKLSRL